MGEASKIEWTDHTFNPWVGCEKISPGCDHCYAEGWAKRAGNPELWNGQRRRTTAQNWRQPFKWNAAAEADGVRARVFCASLADVFDNDVPVEWRVDLMRTIAATQSLDWLLLTKRIGNAHKMLKAAVEPFGMTWGAHWKNVWVGATVVNQDEADRDIPKLLATPARIRFLSIEPMLGAIDLRGLMHRCPTHDFAGGFCLQDCGDWQRLHWAIVGGESGPRARQLEVLWVTHIQRQCREARVPIFIKQLGRFPIAASGEAVTLVDHHGGDMAEWPESMRVREFPG